MERKINLSKIGKNSKIAKAVANSVETVISGQSANESPYFSPVAHRTRNNRNDAQKETKSSSTGIKLLCGETKPTAISESIKKVEKNLTTTSQKSIARKHIKVEYDENKEPIDASMQFTLPVKIKEEVIEEPTEDEKPMKQTKKRKSNDKKTDVKSENIGIKSENDVDNSESTTVEKQSKWEPQNWRQLLANIREMRKERNAPVDTMGCDKCYDEFCDEKTKRFHHLISLMLSSQTKDAVTFEAMSRLRRHGLTPQKMIETSTSDLEQLLYPVGFYKTKAKHIQKTSQILIDKFDSDIPNDIKGLVSLPGVGPKMAHICMHVAWNIVTGIGVDTHVHRIANRLKWVEKETKEPEQTRIALEKWLPFEEWTVVNKLLVGFGQTICTPVSPHCDECLNSAICPSSGIKTKKVKKEKKEKA